MKQKLIVCLTVLLAATGALSAVPSHASPFMKKPVIILPAKIQVTGLVTDSTGSPLPGVTVYVQNDKSIGTTTDMNGKYILEVPGDATLVYSMIGFDEQHILVKERNTINVILKPSSNTLGETVVTAFGVHQKKVDVVGAVTSINPEELKIPSSNLTTALAGKLSGIIAYQRSGEPGADNANFFVRGVTTFGYNKHPLILVDGIEMTATDLARLQVDDIANFSILKDATATALYGARGANGVILINTKEGKEGKAHVEVRFENSISEPTKSIQLADPVTYMKLDNEAVLTRNPLGVTPYTNSEIDNTASGKNPYVYPANDWQSMLFKQYAINQRANMNVSGGGTVARYYLAATFNQDNGVLNVPNESNFNNNINLKTYELRSNVNINITKTTEVGVKLYGTFDDYNGPIYSGTQVYRNVMRTDPVLFPAYFPKDSAHAYLHHILFGNYDLGEYLNPYADMVKGYKEYSQTLMLAQFDLKQNLDFLVKGLTLDAMFNATRYSYFSVVRQYVPFYYQVGFYNKESNIYTLSPINEASGEEFLSYDESGKTLKATTYIQAILNYHHSFNVNHNISGLLVFLMQNQVDGNAGSLQESLPHRNLGVSGRFTYAFKDTYFGEFDFGYNGSERFDKQHRFGFFPSAGLAWQVSNEKFWQPVSSIVNNLKLRATYGLIGNDNIGTASERFFYLSDVNMNDAGKGATFGIDNGYHLNGITVNRYSNSKITWETSYKTNVGMDLGLFNTINITADFWKEHRTNILMTRSYIPTTIGLNANAIPQANVGQANGKGVDLSLDYSKFFTNTFWAKAMANFTYAVTDFSVYEEPQYPDAPWKSHVGYPIDQQWGYIAEHLFIDQKEVENSPQQSFGDYGAGDIKYRDINGDGKITTLDQVPIGYPTSPEIVYGFGVSLGFKNFDFSTFFQGLSRESFWLDFNAIAPFVPYHYDDDPAALNGLTLKNQLLAAIANNHWSESNQNEYALWPRLSTSSSIGNGNNSQTSTWFMRNGSFLRLKDVQVGYTMPSRLTERIKVKSVRFYLDGINLLYWSPFKLWDPEMAGNGLGYPIQRVFNIGVQASF